MAADHDRAGNVYVAGFVAARGAANLSRFDDKGRLTWTIDAIDALSFSTDAHIDVVGTSSGAVVVWRGLRQGKRARVMRYVDGTGKPAATPSTIGSNACAVGDSVFSIGTGKNAGAVVERHVVDGSEQTITTISEGRDPALVCSEGKRAFLVDQGEDDIVMRPIEGGKAHSRVAILGPDDLGDDEIREKEDFSFTAAGTDAFGQLILAESGHLSLRQYGPALGARRMLDHVVASDEDLMAVDGSETHTAIILSREASARCDGDLGTDVVTLDLPAGPGKETLAIAAQGECGRDLGPYWVAPATDAIYVAWSVRGARTGAKAPVEALAWSKLGDPIKSIPLSAEDVVFAGCFGTHCSFAALTRPAGTDGMIPGAAQILTIP